MPHYWSLIQRTSTPKTVYIIHNLNICEYEELFPPNMALWETKRIAAQQTKM